MGAWRRPSSSAPPAGCDEEPRADRRRRPRRPCCEPALALEETAVLEPALPVVLPTTCLATRPQGRARPPCRPCAGSRSCSAPAASAHRRPGALGGNAKGHVPVPPPGDLAAAESVRGSGVGRPDYNAPRTTTLLRSGPQTRLSSAPPPEPESGALTPWRPWRVRPSRVEGGVVAHTTPATPCQRFLRHCDHRMASPNGAR